MKIKITETQFKQLLEDINNGEYDESNDDSTEEISDKVMDTEKYELDANIGRIKYMRELTADIVEYLTILNEELKNNPNIDINKSDSKLKKLLNRGERKKYFFKTHRL